MDEVAQGIKEKRMKTRAEVTAKLLNGRRMAIVYCIIESRSKLFVEWLVRCS